MAVCSFDGCGKAARSRGYCQTHYMRLHRHGSVDLNLPEGFGEKTKHPMYITWMSAKRGGNLCDAWHADFYRFLQDVSPVPEGNWRLQRKVKDLPYSKENVEWKQVVVERRPKESEGSYQKRRYEAKQKIETPEQRRKYSLKTNHGITPEIYQAMFDAQGGVCEICGNPEKKAREDGTLYPLSVDHCHKTRNGGESKGIRGLLCSACNIGLGKFDDEPDLLRKAAAYLEKYRT